MKVVLKNLTKRFPNRTKGKPDVVAVDHFDLELPDGELIGLLGPSGCGKSTALNLISGLEDPTEGQIFFGDTDVTEIPPERRGAGLVFQSYALYPHLTVRQNIQYPLTNLKGKDKLTKEQKLERANEAARLVQIDELMDRKPSELSGGQQQRVAIARALVKLPRVLLLDEPLSNLDARLRLQTREEIRRIQRSTGITTVFVTHDQEEAMSISDRIIVMKSGQIQQVGAPQQVYDDPANFFVSKFLGTPAIDPFHGEVKEETLYLAGQAVLKVKGVADGPVHVGIRPEGFVPDPEGPFVGTLDQVQVLARDTSVIFTHPACDNDSVKAIVPTETRMEGPEARFSLKPDKVHLFDWDTEERIYFEKEAEA